MPRAVILTALPVEYLAVRAHLTALQEKMHPHGTIYEQGKFTADGRTWDVEIVEIGAGNAGAAMEAERAIAHFNPDVILFVGVAGGIKDVAIGDVVAATEVYGYEFGRAEATFSPRTKTRASNYGLEQRAKMEARKSDWMQWLASVPVPPPRVFVAPIAAGEKVVASTQSEVFRFLRSNCGDAIAVEMEGFGFLAAVRANKKVDAIVIRGISDLIDGKAETDRTRSQEIASRHASAFAFQVLSKLEFQNDSAAATQQPQSSSGMTQRNLEKTQGWQTVVQGGTAYIGNINIHGASPETSLQNSRSPFMKTHPQPGQVELFFSYAHEDEALRDKLATHLSTLQRQGVIRQWHDRQIGAGTEWEGQINHHLETAHIILLLISADFIASDYCFDKEVKQAMERHEVGEARVIPVVLRPVDLDGIVFNKLQTLPTDRKPITTWKNQDEAFLNVVKGIRTAIKEIASQGA